ncbi:MAG: HAD family hydrolase [Trichlorobacter sp.]|uniref:NIF family HAD-type phosphatase n=1 Tax=Trichlorobacter sp. TaxID=2911007 RepID=UPI00255F88AC|nr:NIF family HAD-type phosphatase [Trichlorobacter sp.]MDK9716868.1 HAD family hydrolase [Trichlorobacter sp.]
MTSDALVIALDLEGTLISHASTMVPRPCLFEFLTFCHQNAGRVVFMSFVDEERGRQILNQMSDQGHMPEWVRSAEYFHAQGGRPGAKDLRQLGVDPEQTLLVDDQPQVLPREQQHRLIRVPEFREPFDDDGAVLNDVMERIRQKLEKFPSQVVRW